MRPYLPSLAIDWLRESPDERSRLLDGTVVFADISGFTRLTERLAAAGPFGAEELSDLLNSVFTQLFAAAYDYGASLLKWGGDAALLMFRGPDHAARACRAAVEMRATLASVGSLRTTRGPARLRMSVGVHSGLVACFLVGESHRELVVAGEAATTVARLEAAAQPGQVLVSRATAAQLPAGARGRLVGDGVLLRQAPEADPRPNRRLPDARDLPLDTLLSPPVVDHLLSEAAEAEHRRLVTAFIGFTGVAAVEQATGLAGLAAELERLVSAAQRAAARHGVTFLASDLAPDGGKLLIVGGAPRCAGDDDERVLCAAREVLEAPSRLAVRAGVTTGRVFVGDFGPPYRRTYSIAGDAVNLAARLMGRAEPGEVVAARTTAEAVGAPLPVEALPPFRVKGKSTPVHAVRLTAAGPARALPSPRRPADAASSLRGAADELRLLRQSLQPDSDSLRRVVHLVGPSGSGKTRLLHEVAGGPVRTVAVTCDRYHAATPYATARSLLEQLLEGPSAAWDAVLECGSRSIPSFAEWLPLLAPLFGKDLPDTDATGRLAERFRGARQARLLAQLVDVLVPGPLALVVDNCDVCDDTSLRLLVAVVARRSAWPRILVTAAREAPALQVPGRVAVSTVSVAPLSDADARALVRDVAGDTPVPSHVVAAVVARAGGNPLFLRELAAAVTAGRGMDQLPDTVDAAIAQRIDHLPAAARRQLRVASVLGPRFDPQLLGAVAPDADPALLEAFLEPAGAELRFRSPLVRDVAYAGLTFRRRAELHRLAAAAIERRCGGPADAPPELLALHYSAAGDTLAAWTYSRLAGEAAARRYANAEALRFYQDAVRFGAALGAPREDLAAVLEALGDVRSRLGEFLAATDAYLRAGRLHDQASTVTRAGLRLKAAHGYERSGRYPQALRCVSAGLAMLDEHDHTARATRANLLVQYAHLRQAQGRFSDAVRFGRQALEQATHADARDVIAKALQLLDVVALQRGEVDPSNDAARRALAIWQQLGDLMWQGLVLNHLGMRAYFLGNWDAAVRFYEQSHAVLAETGDDFRAAVAHANIGEIRADQGRLAEAEPLLRDALETFIGSGAVAETAYARALLARVAARAGRCSEAHALFERARHDLLSCGLHGDVADLDARVAEVLLLEGDESAALALADDVVARVDQASVAPALPLAHRVRATALARLGDRAQALAALTTAERAAAARRSRYDEALCAVERARIGSGAADPAAAHRARDLLTRLGVVDAGGAEPEAAGALAVTG